MIEQNTLLFLDELVAVPTPNTWSTVSEIFTRKLVPLAPIMENEMTERFYTMDEISTYEVKVTRIKHIEDTEDMFYTEDEFKAMGIDARYICGSHHFKLDSKVRADLQKVADSIKPGRKSAVITDEELLDTVKKYGTIRYLLPGYIRRGNRVCIKPPATIKIKVITNVQLWKRLVWACDKMLGDKYKLVFCGSPNIEINCLKTDKVDLIKFMKVHWSWKEVNVMLGKWGELITTEDMKRIKSMYMKPDACNFK